MVATIGRVDVKPGAVNVIPGEARASLDVRHAVDEVRLRAVDEMLGAAQEIAGIRGLAVRFETLLDQAAVECDRELVTRMASAVEIAGHGVHRMASGAGHDAMIMAEKMPVAMLFLRSPGGISHHPDESVRAEDVDAAIAAGLRFIERL